MLDIKLIRSNPSKVKEAMKGRNLDMDLQIDELIRIDLRRREIISSMEAMKAEQNSVTKKIPLLKKNGEDISNIMYSMKILSDKIANFDCELSELENNQKSILLGIPNMPNERVAVGKDESYNIEIRKWGSPRIFDFEAKAHWDIGKDLDILDSERASKVTGKRFHFYKGLGARLERAIINFFLDTHADNGYDEILPPFIVNRDSMIGTGQLPKFEEDAFKLSNQDFFLIPTAEVPVTNLHRNEIINGSQLPLKYCAYSACFRAEAGSAGRDTKGLIRQHQFNKVELVNFSKPDESYEELEKMTNDAEKVLQLLDLPYRVVELSTGDLGFSSAKTYDIEVWMPSYERYLEISSCSNMEDYQARRAGIRYKKDVKSKALFVHTLNGSGVAIGRTFAAILENYQNQDGSITVPNALIKYMKVSKIHK